MASNAVAREVVEILKQGGQFEDVKDLVAGLRGRRVFDEGGLDAAIWTVGTVMGLIDDIPTFEEPIRDLDRGRRSDQRTPRGMVTPSTSAGGSV